MRLSLSRPPASSLGRRSRPVRRTRSSPPGPSASFHRYSPKDWPGLLRLYLTFEPKATYQGLPPVKPVMTVCWLRTLLLRPKNANFVLTLGDRTIAHAGLVDYPDFPDEREIIIFVHQDYQRRGWGRRMFLATLKHACLALRLRRVWLTVEWDNIPARRLYESIGFVRDWAFLDDTEVEMGRPLHCERCLESDCPIFAADLLRKLPAC